MASASTIAMSLADLMISSLQRALDQDLRADGNAELARRLLRAHAR